MAISCNQLLDLLENDPEQIIKIAQQHVANEIKRIEGEN